MYSRYTSFHYQPYHLPAVEAFWDEVGGPVAARQPGFRGGYVLRSVEQPDLIRAITLWHSEEAYKALESGPDQKLIGEGIRGTSMSTSERDGMETLAVVAPEVGEVRLIRSSIKPEEEDALRAYWPRAKAIIEAAPGCIEANGFIDPNEMIFVLMVRWRTPEEAEAFRESPEHNEQFVPGMERYVTRLDRLRTQPIDKGGRQ
jgi:heme-degrading monooxygenase HmoA